MAQDTTPDLEAMGTDTFFFPKAMCFVKRDFPDGLGWGDCSPALACPEWCITHRSDFVPADMAPRVDR